MQIAPPDFDRMFGALADHTRRDIVRRAIDGEEGVAELASHYPMSFAAVQKHVAILERAGLVTKVRVGRRKVVRTNLEGLRVARRLLDQYEELWRGRIDRMTELVAGDGGGRSMTVTAVRKDPEALTMTVEAEFEASPERVWQLWADPRQLERWWGPPTYPATFTKHDLAPGSRIEYHMTGPEGDQPKGFWDIDEVDAPRSLVFRDGFANDDGSPNTDLPQNTLRVPIEETTGGRTRMSIESRLPQHRGHGAGARHGHGAGADASGRPDRRDPRRGRRPHRLTRRREGDHVDDHRDRAHDAHPRRSPARR